MGRVSQDSQPRKSFPRKAGKLGSKHAVQFSKRTWHPKNFWREWVLPEGSFRSVRAMLEYHPISRKNQTRLHQFGKKVLLGIFLGYVLSAGRVREILSLLI